MLLAFCRMDRITLGIAIVALSLLVSSAVGQEDPNQPPDCTGSLADVATLWPPNHKMVPVAIGGVTDPDGDVPEVTVTGVTQDEPLVGAGGGDACPDAEGAELDETVGLRAERSGRGDGRVYHVAFVAEDGRGGTCTGEVTVCVPHDQGQGSVCGDGGPLVDSTGGDVLCDGEACYAEECAPVDVPAPCVGAPLPAGIARRIDRAVLLLDRAGLADRPAQEVRWRLRAGRLLRKAAAAAGKAAARGGLALGCGDALATQLGGAATCAACLLPPEE
jgi:hypothetical protein